MAIDVTTLALAKAYAKGLLESWSGSTGKNVTIESIVAIDGGNRITFGFTDDNGVAQEKALDVMDGKDGADGKNGTNGTNGKDGTSPVISVSTITGGHRITITDANGTKTVDVMDGSDGKNGNDGASGDDGVTPQFSIGTVETLEAGSAATASIVGTAEKPVLNLGIPKGKDGSSDSGGNAELKDALTDYAVYYTPSEWFNGSVVSNEIVERPNRAITNLFAVRKGTIVDIESGYEFSVHVYNSNGEHLSGGEGWFTDRYTVNVEDASIRVQIRKSDNSNIDLTNLPIVRIRHILVATKDDLGVIKDDLVATKDDLGVIKDDLVATKDDLVATKDDLAGVKKNILDVLNFTKGYYLNANGEIVDSYNSFISNKYDVEHIDKLYAISDGTVVYRIAQYTASDEYIDKSYTNITGNTEISINRNAQYAMVSVGKWDGNNSIDDFLSAVKMEYYSEVSKIIITNRTNNVWNAVVNGCDPNGENDCSVIVQNEIDKWNSDIVLFFPVGTYKFNKPITMRNKNNIKIVGCGCCSHPDTSTKFNISIGSDTFIKLYGGSYIDICDIFLCSISDDANDTAIGFYDDTPDSSNCRIGNTHIDNVRIEKFKYGVRIDAPSGYNYFDNVHIANSKADAVGFRIGYEYKNTTGIIPNYIYLNRCKVDNLNDEADCGVNICCGQMIWISECDFCNFVNGYGINIINSNRNCGVVDNVFIKSTSIFNNKYGVNIHSYSNDRISNITIINNMMIFFNSESYGVVVNKKDDAAEIYGLTILGNVFPPYIGLKNNFVKLLYEPTNMYIAGTSLD